MTTTTNTVTDDNKQKPKLKLKLRQKNPYGKIIEGRWPPREDVEVALKRGPTAIAQWQTAQIEELIVPHLTGTQIHSIITKLKLNPSVLFERIYDKLLAEFLGNTLNALNAATTTNDSDRSSSNRDKLLNILKHSLRFIRVAQFKQLNIEILSRINPIPKAVLRILSDAKNVDLVHEFPINIKRQIWEFKLSLFDKEFDAIFERYVASKCNDDDSTYFDSVYKLESMRDNVHVELTKIKRANNDILKEIANNIGSTAALLHRCFGNLEKRYCALLSSSSSSSSHALINVCNFRVDLSCSLYDHAHQHLIAENDPIWSLIHMLYYENAKLESHRYATNDAVTDCNILSPPQIDLMHKSLSDPQRIIQTSMLLNIPFIRSVLFRSFIALLEHLANKQILPRDSKPFSLLTSILQITSQPFKWYQTQQSNHASSSSSLTSRVAVALKLPKPDARVLFQLAPILTNCIYIDSLNLDALYDELHNAGNGDDDADEYDARLRLIVTQHTNFNVVQWCHDCSVCVYIVLYYVLHLLYLKRVRRCVELMNAAIGQDGGARAAKPCKYVLDNAHLLSTNGLTEINLICHAMLDIMQQNIADTKQKRTFLQFLLCLVQKISGDPQVMEPIANVVQNSNLSYEEINNFMQQLRQ